MRDNKAKGIPRTLLCNILKCSICGAEYELSSFDMHKPLPQLMKKRGLCFNCAFWIDKIESPNPDREIINGEHYMFPPSCPNQDFKRTGGRRVYVMRNDGSLISSNNMWFQGVIPERFREKLTDTAKFISKQTFLKIQSNPFKCISKGCWDRYHCLRYEISIEEKSGPWNVIPQKHIVGQEECESFINKNKL